jgi:hypothetical protein
MSCILQKVTKDPFNDMSSIIDLVEHNPGCLFDQHCLFDSIVHIVSMLNVKLIGYRDEEKN